MNVTYCEKIKLHLPVMAGMKKGESSSASMGEAATTDAHATNRHSATLTKAAAILALKKV